MGIGDVIKTTDDGWKEVTDEFLFFFHTHTLYFIFTRDK